MTLRPVALFLLLALIGVTTGCRHVEAPPVTPVARPLDPGSEKVAWILIQLGGFAPPPQTSSRPATLRFDSGSSRISGFTGVNRFFGTYKNASVAIQFSDIGSTRMAGPPEAMALEQSFLAMLKATDSWIIKDGMLHLIGDRKVLASFSKGGEAESR